MATRDTAAEEMAVFRSFVQASRANIDETSIRAGDDPPDLMCRSSEYGDTAFELVRVEDKSIYEGVAKALNDRDAGGSYDELKPIRKNVEKKLSRYGDDTFAAFARAELLAYRLFLPDWPEDFSKRRTDELQTFFSDLLPESPFKRVWLFNWNDGTVLLSVP